MPFTFPIQLFQPSSIKPELVARVIEGPDSLSGNNQAIRTDGGGYWRCEIGGIALLTSDQIRAHRAWEDYMAGGAEQFLVPIADIRHAPRPAVGNQLMRPGPLLVTGTDPYFPEALGYGVPVVIATAGEAGLRATQLSISVSQGGRVVGGQYFSITHTNKGRRMYRTGRVISRTGQSATVNIVPPLREAIGPATSLDFDFPSFLATLAPNTDTAAELLFARSANVSFSFREAF